MPSALILRHGDLSRGTTCVVTPNKIPAVSLSEAANHLAPMQLHPLQPLVTILLHDRRSNREMVVESQGERCGQAHDQSYRRRYNH